MLLKRQFPPQNDRSGSSASTASVISVTNPAKSRKFATSTGECIYRSGNDTNADGIPDR